MKRTYYEFGPPTEKENKMKPEYGICKGRYMTSDGYCAMSLESGKKKITRCTQIDCGLWNWPKFEDAEPKYEYGGLEIKSVLKFIEVSGAEGSKCIINIDHISVIEPDAITLPNTVILIEPQEYERIKKLLEVQ